jgi:hypothetical protein
MVAVGEPITPEEEGTTAENAKFDTSSRCGINPKF